jgi:hypothetical protein
MASNNDSNHEEKMELMSEMVTLADCITKRAESLVDSFQDSKEDLEKLESIIYISTIFKSLFVNMKNDDEVIIQPKISTS